jgi:hypothetical protein
MCFFFLTHFLFDRLVPLVVEARGLQFSWRHALSSGEKAERARGVHTQTYILCVCVCVFERESVCVCVCVCGCVCQDVICMSE